MSSPQNSNNTDFYIGLALAISSSLFIGSSFIIKKKALIKINNLGHLRASSGGHGYLKQWIWWTGFLSMAIGELANFAAYAFTSASLITPLGSLSVLVSAILSSKFLNEKLNLLGKIGCLLCITGSTITVIHSPKEEEIDSLELLFQRLRGSDFLLYIAFALGFSLMGIFYFGPRYGQRHVIVYLSICSAIGSLTVMSCKGLGLVLKHFIRGTLTDFGIWLGIFFLISIIIFITLQMNYLNKSLDIFNTGIVTPVYYVLFTSLVICASAILFQEWKYMTAFNVLGNLCGFITIIVGIILLNGFKDIDLSLYDISNLSSKDIINENYQMHESLLWHEVKSNYHVGKSIRTL